MRGLPERALLVLASGACALTIGLVAWPGSGPASTSSVDGVDPVAPDSGVSRRSPAIPAPAGELPEPRSQAQPALEPEADASDEPAPVHASVRGRVVHADGSPAGGASVWSPVARTLADADGSFELAGASAGDVCHATLPGFQPAEGQLGARGSTLQLGPPALSITGRIRAEDGLETQGWRIAVLDATLIEPVGLEATTLESAASRSPARVQTAADGSFAIDGLSPHHYTLAAWRGAHERIEIYAPASVSPGPDPVEILIPPAAARRTVELRCVDARGTPLASVRVGLPGTPPIAATDPDGKLVFEGCAPAQITLVLSLGDGSVLVRVVDLSAPADIVLGGR